MITYHKVGNHKSSYYTLRGVAPLTNSIGAVLSLLHTQEYNRREIFFSLGKSHMIYYYHHSIAAMVAVISYSPIQSLQRFYDSGVYCYIHSKGCLITTVYVF
jgi:hypothetical protein